MPAPILPAGLHDPLVEGSDVMRRAPPPAIAAERYDARSPRDLLSTTESDDVIDAQVAYAFAVVRASGAVQNQHGSSYNNIRKLDDDVSVLIEQETRRILKRLVENMDIAIDEITSTFGPDYADVEVKYRNLRVPAKRRTRVFRSRFKYVARIA